MDSLGNRIRQLRGSRSQSTYAAQLGISKGALGCYERDANNPDASVLAVICTIEGVSADWLLFGRNAQKSDDAQDTPCGDDRELLQELERRLHFVEDMIDVLMRDRKQRISVERCAS